MVLLILFYGCGRQPRVCIKKPTTVASRGLLSKSHSASTSHGGIAGYGDYNGCDL
jgi:hypothetical protein